MKVFDMNGESTKRKELISSEEIIDKIPTPEEVFKMPINLRNKILFLWGSAVIALGVSIGSGEFLLGPSMAIKIGMGLAWLVWIGSLLQTIYIYSWGKFSVALGETPIAIMYRVGAWAGILGSILVFASFIWGGWAYSSAAALAGGVLGRPPGPQDRIFVAILGYLLLLLALFIMSLGRRVARTLEIFNWFDLGVIFMSFVILAIILVPIDVWSEVGRYMVSIGNIPEGVDPVLLGGWWGYIGYATGINYILVNYFKDKGYGMGSITGFIPAIIGGKAVPFSPRGKLFKLTKDNIKTYRRWLNLMLEELFIVFFLGAIAGMILPMTLAYALAYGWKVEALWGVPIWLAYALKRLYGDAGWVWGVLVAIFVLIKTQMGVADAMVRAFIDSFWRSEGVRRFFGNDVRKAYYLLLIIIFLWASVAFWVSAPVALILIAANAANIGAVIAGPLLIYINYKMPKELRLHWGLIILNIIFIVMCGVFLAYSIGRTLGLV
jgi:hypothetical protein